MRKMWFFGNSGFFWDKPTENQTELSKTSSSRRLAHCSKLRCRWVSLFVCSANRPASPLCRCVPPSPLWLLIFLANGASRETVVYLFALCVCGVLFSCSCQLVVVLYFIVLFACCRLSLLICYRAKMSSSRFTTCVNLGKYGIYRYHIEIIWHLLIPNCFLNIIPTEITILYSPKKLY